MEKQTVYLPVVKHNVFCKYRILNEDGVTEHLANKEEAFVFTPEQLNEYTANVIRQALETAAEKAAERAETYRDKEFYMLSNVSKKSITNTFEETFKKFKV